MSHERKQVLELLAQGKITAAEAERLLDKLEQSEPSSEEETPSESGTSDVEPAARLPKYLRIHVDGSDGEKVNIRVPVALIKTGIKLSTMLPDRANERLEEKGIDLSQFSGKEGDELLEALRELTVDVDGSDGETVRIYCE